MGELSDSLIKRREILFCPLHPDPRQAETACGLLRSMDGVLAAEVVTPNLLSVRYQLLEVTLAELEAHLEAQGLHLDNSLLHKLRRSLYHYTEETQRANLGCAKGEHNCTQKVFASNYRRRAHGCRDERPEHWRRYL